MSEKAKGVAAEAKDKSATPTEEHEEWIFTINSATGDLVKVEKVNKATGERQELSNEEYASYYAQAYAAYAYDPYAATYMGYGYAPYGYDPYASYAYYYPGYW